jgi:ABC-type proline/glycine betaine transport system substrate-binding protein
MTSTNTIQISITGHGYSGDQREVMQALALFYHALNERDLDMMQRNWDNSAEAAMDNSFGGNKARLGRH